MLELGAEAEPVLLVRTASRERHGRVSPDGSTLAYESDESGRNEIYLKRFPSGEGKWQVSLTAARSRAGVRAATSCSGAAAPDLMVAEVRTAPEITLGTPRLLFLVAEEIVRAMSIGWYEYDIAPDGERFVMVARKDEPEPSDSTKNMLMLVENWSAE